jgi:hypothetical protein
MKSQCTYPKRNGSALKKTCSRIVCLRAGSVYYAGLRYTTLISSNMLMMLTMRLPAGRN